VSVRLSQYSAVARSCGWFAAVGPAAGRRYRLIAARRTVFTQNGAQQQMRVVPRYQLTHEAEHGLVFIMVYSL